MNEQRVYGHTKGGEPITDQMVERFADEAERGYQPGQLKDRRRGPGRPPLGEAAKSVESVRLEPALQAEVAHRAQAEGLTVSEVVRKALRQYLKSVTTSAFPKRATAGPSVPISGRSGPATGKETAVPSGPE